MTNRNERMNVLKENGFDISNFFDLSLRIPLGSIAHVNIDGKELTVRATKDVSVSDSVLNGYIGVPISGAENTTADAIGSINDQIVQDIVSSGYIFNSRVDGRWVTAQTFRMLNEPSYNYKARQTEYGWDAYLKNYYPYMYCFSMMADELHKLAKMQRNNDPDFSRLSNFFTKEVVYETCEHYLKQLKKFIKNQKTRKCRGIPYVKLNKYGNVFIKDLDYKVYGRIRIELNNMKNANDYTSLEKCLKSFMNVMVKLPTETPKCSVWKDAFKGKGAYVSLLNICKFHDVKVLNYETGELLNRDESVNYIESKLSDYKGQYWKFHELLKATIKSNDFDLRKSIVTQSI